MGFVEVSPGNFHRVTTPTSQGAKKSPEKPRHLQHIQSGTYIVADKSYRFRSKSEYIFALYLQLQLDTKAIASWEYEPHRFYFDGIKRGVTSYLPDFRVTEHSGKHWWAEVKGWMDQRSATALKRMKKYHPNERVAVFDAAFIKSLIQSGLIPKHLLENPLKAPST